MGDKTIISIIRLVNEYVILKAIISCEHLLVCIHILFAFLGFLRAFLRELKIFIVRNGKFTNCVRVRNARKNMIDLCDTSLIALVRF